MDNVTLIGSLGASLMLLAFVMLQIKKWPSDGVTYDLANLLGGALLVCYAWLLRSWPFLILNGIWTLVALRDLIRDSVKKKV